MPLSDDRVKRWARQLLVPGFGEEGQERLLASRVRVVGLEGVVTPALVYLVQAGVGRLWLDDPETVSPADLAGWLYPPSAVGTPRATAARAALAPLSAFIQVDAYPTGGVPTAALVAAPSLAQALHASEACRRAAIPHVVFQPDADGGSVVVVPPGAPCFSCSRSGSDAGRPPTAATGALAALAAQELLQMVADPGKTPGRRVELVRGVASARPTLRLAGCACNGEAGRAEE